MASDRSLARRAAPVLAVAALAGGCQLLSGLSGLHEGSSSGAGGATSTAGSTGGATVSSTGPSTSSSDASSTSASTTTTTSTSATSSSGGCFCGGGPCMGAVCIPYVLIDDPGGTPTGLASDGTFLYWSVQGPLAKPPQGFISRQAISVPDNPHPVAATIYPTHLVVDATTTYWSDQQIDPLLAGILGRSSDATGPVTTRYATTSTDPPAALLLNGTRLAWNLPTLGQIRFGPINGGTPAIVDAKAIGSHFAADGINAYWTDPMAVWAQPFGSDPMDAGAATQLATVSNVSNLVADTIDGIGFLYLAAPSGIFRSFKAGGGLTPFVTGVVAGELLVDALNLYFTHSQGGTCTTSPVLEKVSVTGGTPQVIAHLQGCPVLAQDAENLFWIDGGKIWRVVKQ